MLDAGQGWQNSTVFNDDFFGPVRTFATDDYVVTSGPFAYLPSVWDESGVYSHITTENAYGVITESFNPIKSPYMQRSSRFCGRENKQPMAGCEDAIRCMKSKHTLGEWDLCLEIKRTESARHRLVVVVAPTRIAFRVRSPRRLTRGGVPPEHPQRLVSKTVSRSVLA